MQLTPRRASRWSVRARVRNEFARVSTPAATLWPRSVAGLVAGAWACAMSLLLFVFVIVLAWVLAPMGSGQFGDVLRASASIWMLANGGALEWHGSSLSLTPLLLTFVLLLFMRRAGGWLADAVDADAAAGVKQAYAFAIAAVASVQLLIGAAVQNAGLHPVFGRSLLGAIVVAAVGFGWGLGRALGVELPEAWHIHRVSMQRYVVALTASGVLLSVLSAVVHRGAFVDVLQAVSADVTSSVQLLAACAVFVPTLAMWFVSALLGPGFSFGIGTQISLSGVHIGALPPIPLLALIPNNPPPWAQLLFVVPVVAAVWATRPLPREESGMLHLRSVVELLLLGALAGAGLGLLGSGGLGPGRLAQIGPVLWKCALSSAAWLALACVGDELVRRIRALAKS